MNTKQKTIFIIPGFNHTPTQKSYKSVARILTLEGYTPIPISIPWASASVFDGTDIFLKEYKKVTTGKKYILGFSFGAMIAFLASTKVKPAGVILCSLSPYFEEDISHAPLRRLPSNRKRNVKSFSSLHSARLAKKIKTDQILMLYGTKEAKSLIRRVNETFDHIKAKDKVLFSINNADHDIGGKRYLQKILQAAKVLN